MMAPVTNRQVHFVDFTSRMDSFMSDEDLGQEHDDPASSDGDGDDDAANDTLADHRTEDSDDGVDVEKEREWSEDEPILDPESRWQVRGGVSTPFLWHDALKHVEPDPYAVANSEDNDDALMDTLSEEDEEEYFQALLDEEKLDEADMEADKEAQARLWERINNNNSGLSHAEASTLKGKYSRYRHAESDARLGVKSNAYVEDSD